MISENIKNQILQIWDKYVADNKKVHDVRGNDLGDIDKDRIEAIKTLKQMVFDFNAGKTSLGEFKTEVDSFNKQNNLWGFTAVKGQMFFNQLVKYSEPNTDKLIPILKDVISEPTDLNDSLQKIETLEKYCIGIFSKAKDKRKAPNPKSVGYFLSYFWQIHNHEKWPIIYSSILLSFAEIGLWTEIESQAEGYSKFYKLNEEVKEILRKHTGRNITNWEAEHSFWNFKKISSSGGPKPEKKKKGITKVDDEPDVETETVFEPNFKLTDYLIPRVARLMELGAETSKSSSAKGSEFEKMVSEIFRQLDFEVEVLGQGSGRNPDAIAKFREENTAFIIDAKAYGGGYSLGIDDRAIKEYINYYCPKLQKEGYKKIGFIIVSNSFKTSFDSFINDITWDTDIKRFILLTSEALLYLLAYKTKDKLSLSAIIESMIGFGNLISARDVIQEFDDL